MNRPSVRALTIRREHPGVLEAAARRPAPDSMRVHRVGRQGLLGAAAAAVVDLDLDVGNRRILDFKIWDSDSHSGYSEKWDSRANHDSKGCVILL